MIQNAYYSQTPYSLNILSYIQATLFASNRSRARVLRRALPVNSPIAHATLYFCSNIASTITPLLPWNDEGEEGETLCEKTGMGNTYKAFAKPNADWCLKCECPGMMKERKGKLYCEKTGMGNTYKAFAKPNALERRRRGRGNFMRENRDGKHIQSLCQA